MGASKEPNRIVYLQSPDPWDALTSLCLLPVDLLHLVRRQVGHDVHRLQCDAQDPDGCVALLKAWHAWMLRNDNRNERAVHAG